MPVTGVLAATECPQNGTRQDAEDAEIKVAETIDKTGIYTYSL